MKRRHNLQPNLPLRADPHRTTYNLTCPSGLIRTGQPKKGFTLIEIIVAVGILSIIFTLAVGIFSRFVFLQNRVIGEQTIQEDLQFSLELFNRELRTGYGSTYEAVQPDWLVFRNQNRVCIAYRLENNMLARAEAELPEEDDDCAGAREYTFDSITSPETSIDNLTFQAQQADFESIDQKNQGFVTMQITAHAIAKPKSSVSIQNTVTSRQVVPFNPDNTDIP